MSSFSTHVLDTVTGRPGSGIPVSLFWEDGKVASGSTNADGRFSADIALETGIYRLVFELGEGFYPEVQVSFRVMDSSAHYHVPLLLSRFGYTTYRGS